ncbi:MAG: hexose kinase [Anaerolineales bacterium]|jgi:1-phosphofructokinase family hexose kinase
MILTVTANSALDRVIFIEEFRPTTVMRPSRVLECAGGKGLDTSVALQGLGVPNFALAFAAGSTGERLREVMNRRAMQYELVWGQGETRIAHVIVESLYHRHSHITIPGFRLADGAWEKFLRIYRTNAARAEWVVVAGSLAEGAPAEGYYILTTMARQTSVPILIDCPGDPILRALPAKPTVVKMNWREFGETFDLQCPSLPTLALEVARLRQQHDLTSMVITLGPEGVLAVTAEGSFLATSPLQVEVNGAGAGDGVSAALAWRLSLGDPWPQALRWAAATGAAVVLTEGTAECHLEDVQRIYANTTVRAL